MHACPPSSHCEECLLPDGLAALSCTTPLRLQLLVELSLDAGGDRAGQVCQLVRVALEVEDLRERGGREIPVLDRRELRVEHVAAAHGAADGEAQGAVGVRDRVVHEVAGPHHAPQTVVLNKVVLPPLAQWSPCPLVLQVPPGAGRHGSVAWVHDQRRETAAVHGRLGVVVAVQAREAKDGRRNVHVGGGLLETATRADARPADDQRYADVVVVDVQLAGWQAVLPQVEAVVGGDEHVRGVGDPELVQHLDHARDGVVDGEQRPPTVPEELVDLPPLFGRDWPLLGDEPMVVRQLLC
mmetsp:Transcript_75456/g.233424  ORF Transcript_75456/g.233424 Transcript_75456/m.233424 type:complete len:297 (+) Transcript_75456:181-1071(+)